LFKLKKAAVKRRPATKLIDHHVERTTVKSRLIPIALALTIALTGCGKPGEPSSSANVSELPFARGLQKVLDFSVKITDGTGISAAVIIADQGTWTGASGNSEPAQPITPEQVGAAIANLYAVLYGETNSSFQKASLLRAQAAHVRDQGGVNADWEQVEALLQESYRELAAGSVPPISRATPLATVQDVPC
jgi:hypothetical protein